MVILTFILVNEISSDPILRATLFMFWGTYWLIDLLKVLFADSKYVNLGSIVMFWVGSILCCLSILWLANTALKTLNPLFLAINWEYQIGNIFNGIHQYIFSIPSFISGLVLLFVALIWDKDVQYWLWEVVIKYVLEKGFKTKKSEL